MAHEILSVKLYELDKKFACLHGRIHMSEAAGYEQLHEEVEAFRRECTEKEMELRNMLRYSKSEVVAELAEAYNKVEQVIRQTKEKISRTASDEQEGRPPAEDKLLLAEYSLDFAMQAANRALLISLEAIEEQRKTTERKERII